MTCTRTQAAIRAASVHQEPAINRPANHDTFSLHSHDLPVWTFTTWTDLEAFLDELCPDDYSASIDVAIDPGRDVLGLIHSRDPMTPATAVAAYRILHPH